MFNPFKKKCEPLVVLDDSVEILSKSELDAMLYLVNKFKAIGDEGTCDPDEVFSPQSISVMSAFSEMFTADMLNVTYCFHRPKGECGPVCLKIENARNKYMFLQTPWENENPYVQILELMPYIIYTSVYFLYGSDPGIYPCSINNQTAAMFNLCAYYSACVEYVLSVTTGSMFINKELLDILTTYDKKYLDHYCNIYVTSFSKK
jgi:hypothetical protein